jgi:hypothetical protein
MAVGNSNRRVTPEKSALKKVDGKWRAIERTIMFDLDGLRNF